MMILVVPRGGRRRERVGRRHHLPLMRMRIALVRLIGGGSSPSSSAIRDDAPVVVPPPPLMVVARGMMTLILGGVSPRWYVGGGARTGGGEFGRSATAMVRALGTAAVVSVSVMIAMVVVALVVLVALTVRLVRVVRPVVKVRSVMMVMIPVIPLPSPVVPSLVVIVICVVEPPVGRVVGAVPQAPPSPDFLGGSRDDRRSPLAVCDGAVAVVRGRIVVMILSPPRFLELSLVPDLVPVGLGLERLLVLLVEGLPRGAYLLAEVGEPDGTFIS